METLSSQYFHLDFDDVIQIKVFLYVTPVTDSSGPTHFIDSKVSKTIVRKLKYSLKSAENVRVQDEHVLNLLEGNKIHSATGPTGTLCFLDTSQCLHYGSRPGKSSRFIILFQYITPFAFSFPRDWKTYAPFRGIPTKGLKQYERLILGHD